MGGVFDDSMGGFDDSIGVFADDASLDRVTGPIKITVTARTPLTSFSITHAKITVSTTFPIMTVVED